MKLLKPDASTHIGQLVDYWPSEIFAALFELELSGKLRQMPRKNFVKSFSPSVSGSIGGGVCRVSAALEFGTGHTSSPRSSILPAKLLLAKEYRAR